MTNWTLDKAPRPAPGVAVPDRRRKLAGGGHAADRADPQRRDRRRSASIPSWFCVTTAAACR
ncbi:hypothetical protein ACPA9J_10680 [Pseudomonas aeruginosa]